MRGKRAIYLHILNSKRRRIFRS